MQKLAVAGATLSCLTFAAYADQSSHQELATLSYYFPKHADLLPWLEYRNGTQRVTVENIKVELKAGDLWVNIDAESNSDGTSHVSVMDILSYADGLNIDCQDVDVDYPVAAVDLSLERGTIDFATSPGDCSSDETEQSHIHVQCTANAEHKVDINAHYSEKTPAGSTKGSITVSQTSADCRMTITKGGESIVLDDLASGTLTRVRE